MRQILDDTQNIVNQYDFEGFGTSLSSSENIYNRYRYIGREYDKETESDPTYNSNEGTKDGLYYYRARTYDTTIGSFTSRDPIPARNLYSYCNANPVIHIDPKGMKPGEIVPVCAFKDADGNYVRVYTKVNGKWYRLYELIHDVDYPELWNCSKGNRLEISEKERKELEDWEHTTWLEKSLNWLKENDDCKILLKLAEFYAGLEGIEAEMVDARAHGTSFGEFLLDKLLSPEQLIDALTRSGAGSATIAQLKKLTKQVRKKLGGCNAKLKNLIAEKFKNERLNKEVLLLRDGVEKVPGDLIQSHHLFPHKFKDWFEKQGININHPDFGMWLDAKTHGSINYKWNKAWDEFIKGHKEGASYEEIIKFKDKLIKDFGLSEADVSKYKIK